MHDTTHPTVVLVHGAFADASGWNGVSKELRANGYDVVAPPNPLRGLHADAHVVHEVAHSITGPAVLTGHSYGGAVITQGAADLDNVIGLVYFAAFGIDEGESAASVQGPFPPSLLSHTAVTTSYDAPGAAGGPDLYIATERFRETFCADLLVDSTEAMAHAQRPLSVAALTEPATKAAWKSKPSWYQIAEQDHAIAPETQRFMGQRMNATGVADAARYPVVDYELGTIRAWLHHGLPTLGICLGAQLIASALGAPVRSTGRVEIGFRPMRLTDAGRNSVLSGVEQTPVLHWLGDEFGIPRGAQRLAGTAGFPTKRSHTDRTC